MAAPCLDLLIPEAERRTSMGAHPTAASLETFEVDGLDVRMREFRPGDEPQCVEVYRAAFDGFFPARKPVDECDYVSWFTERHGSHRGRVTLAEVGSRIVAVSGGLRRRIKIGGVVLYGTAGGLGSATHPEFQRKKIGQARSRWNAASEDPPRTGSVDTRRAGTRSRRDNPASSAGRMGVYLKVLKPWRALSDGVGVLNLPSCTAAALWARLRPAARDEHHPIELRTLQSFDERFEPFLDRVTERWDVTPLRSVEYLNWRFFDPRAGRFVVRAAEDRGTLVGYAVAHTEGRRGHIVDVFTEPHRRDVARALIADAVDQLRALDVWAVQCWMLEGHAYAPLLREQGFVRRPRRSGAIAKEVGWFGSGIGPAEQALLADPATRIHLVRADFDGI